MSEPKLNNHIIGHARTIQTAVLVCEYLRKALAQPHSSVHPDTISYWMQEPSADNGFWSADIVIRTAELDLKTSNRFVNTCRAFVAGRGEIWV